MLYSYLLFGSVSFCIGLSITKDERFFWTPPSPDTTENGPANATVWINIKCHLTLGCGIPKAKKKERQTDFNKLCTIRSILGTFLPIEPRLPPQERLFSVGCIGHRHSIKYLREYKRRSGWCEHAGFGWSCRKDAFLPNYLVERLSVISTPSVDRADRGGSDLRQERYARDTLGL